MHETDATMIVSRRESRFVVAACRSRSMSSLRELSFSMYRSACGTYASGW